MAPVDNYNTDTKYKYLGRPKMIALSLDPDWPAELVRTMEVLDSLVREIVYLGDFGLTIKAGTSVSEIVQSPAMYVLHPGAIS